MAEPVPVPTRWTYQTVEGPNGPSYEICDHGHPRLETHDLGTAVKTTLALNVLEHALGAVESRCITNLSCSIN